MAGFGIPLTRELTHEEVVAKLRELITQEGSQKAAAFKLGVSDQYLSDVMRWKPPSRRILDFLGIDVVTIYRTRG